jgi:hypothetical protein
MAITATTPMTMPAIAPPDIWFGEDSPPKGTLELVVGTGDVEVGTVCAINAAGSKR